MVCRHVSWTPSRLHTVNTVRNVHGLQTCQLDPKQSAHSEHCTECSWSTDMSVGPQAVCTQWTSYGMFMSVDMSVGPQAGYTQWTPYGMFMVCRHVSWTPSSLHTVNTVQTVHGLQTCQLEPKLAVHSEHLTECSWSLDMSVGPQAGCTQLTPYVMFMVYRHVSWNPSRLHTVNTVRNVHGLQTCQSDHQAILVICTDTVHQSALYICCAAWKYY